MNKITPGQIIIFKVVKSKIKYKILDNMPISSSYDEAILVCLKDKSLYPLQWSEFWSEAIFDKLKTKFAIVY